MHQQSNLGVIPEYAVSAERVGGSSLGAWAQASGGILGVI